MTRDAAGYVAVLSGSVPFDKDRCQEDLVSSRLIEFSVDLPAGSGGGTLLAAFWASDLVDGIAVNQSHWVAVIDRRDSSILSAPGCEVDQEGIWAGEAFGLGSLPKESGSFGTFPVQDRRGRREGAYASVQGFELDVVATSSLSEALGSLRQLTLLYWLLVLALGVSTAMAFSFLITPFTRSLAELSRAAEEIGTGELDPWLPVPSSGELGQLTMAFSRMLARIRQMVNQVNQSGRLAVVGQLSAYLAHEIRNPLSSIKLNLQRLRRWAQKGQIPSFCIEPLEISIREVDRLNVAVSGVLELSKAEDSPREVVSLHHLVEEAADLVASRFRRQGVGLSLDLDAEADLVVARPGQLKSVVLNLMVNALEAQPSGGHLEVRSALRTMPEMSGPAVALHFFDEGSGVPADIRDRIFEPFFTTKTGGAGIGLAMAMQAVQDNGGDLSLAPSFSRDTGAEFVVAFPLAPSDARTRRIPGMPAARGVPGEEHVSTAGGGEDPIQLLSPGGLGKVLPDQHEDTEESN
jgi:signal transduction histidine kinase